MNKHYVLFLPVITIGLLTIPRLSAGAAEAQGSALAELLTQAVRADGLGYVNARKAIVDQKAAALPLLKSKLADPDWHTRLLAEAMIGRIEAPEEYTTYEYHAMAPIGASQMYRVVTFYSLNEAVNGGYYDSTRRDTRLTSRHVRKRRFGTAGAPFLVEVALKGSALKKPTMNFHLPADSPDAKYTIAEVAVILNVNEKLASQWMGSKARNEGGTLLVKHRDLRSFVNAYLRPDRSTSAVAAVP